MTVIQTVAVRQADSSYPDNSYEILSREIFHKVEAYSTFLNVPQRERQGADIINKYNNPF